VGLPLAKKRRERHGRSLVRIFDLVERLLDKHTLRRRFNLKRLGGTYLTEFRFRCNRPMRGPYMEAKNS